MNVKQVFGLSKGMKVGGTVLNSGSDPWQAVAAPSAAFSFVPFTIQQNGRVFRPDPSFDIRARANISVSVEKYVDKSTGSDTNSGDDWDHAYATPTKAYSASADRIYIAKGWYYRNQIRFDVYPRSCEFIGVLTRGSGDGVYMTADGGNQVGAWSHVDNHYEATYAGTLLKNAWDATNLDVYGQHTQLTAQASVAAVDGAANSWYSAAGVLYVRTFDDRPPDADVHYYETTLCIAMTSDNRTLYAENVFFYGGNVAALANNTATGGAKFYAKNCEFAYPYDTKNSIMISGLDEWILQDCSIHKNASSGDGINIVAKNGIAPKGIEINCDSYQAGIGGTNQASTLHDASTVVRIMGKYHHVGGQCIADTAGSQTWMLGSEVYESNVYGTNPGQDDGINILDAGANAWLDCVTIHDCAVDLRNNAGATIYTRNLVSGGNNVIGGTLAPY